MENGEGIHLFSKSASRVSILKEENVTIRSSVKIKRKKKSIYESYPIQTITYNTLLKEQSILNSKISQNDPIVTYSINKEGKRKRRNRTRKIRRELK
jgi:hypothetical protein